MKLNRVKKISSKKIIYISYLINILIISLLLVMFIYGYFNSNLLKENISVIILIILAVVINGYITIKDTYKLKGILAENDIKNEIINNTNDLNKKLRAQRHDFINHLQVVYSLIEMNEFDESKKYIETIYEDIQKINKVMKTSIPAINALLQAKMTYCESNNIDSNINITSTLKNLIVPDWEMCRVIGNLIDNAAYECKDSKLKFFQINISEDIENYIIEVKNSGKAIPSELLSKIFEPGFTTKSDNGQGMGLYIAKDIVEKYGGKIEVNSGRITEFKIIIPYSKFNDTSN